jgi:hypothetical protein
VIDCRPFFDTAVLDLAGGAMTNAESGAQLLIPKVPQQPLDLLEARGYQRLSKEGFIDVSDASASA